MIKKYILAATMAAFLATPPIVEAPVNVPIVKEFPIKVHKGRKHLVMPEDRIEKLLRENKKKLDKLTEEMKLAHEDEIYDIICGVYRSLNLDIPNYITKRLIREVVNIESWDYPKAIGKDGERGLTQMMKQTWYLVEHENFERNAFIPYKSIRASLKYFLMNDDALKANYPNWENIADGEKIKMLIASYNGGFGNLMFQKWKLSKMKPVTKDYLKRVNEDMNWILSDYDYQNERNEPDKKI